MLDVQSQVSNFMFSLSFHTLMVVPSSEAGEPSQAWEGTPMLPNWTATIIPSAWHMFHVHNFYFPFQSH
jgi:hypothetical protein